MLGVPRGTQGRISECHHALTDYRIKVTVLDVLPDMMAPASFDGRYCVLELGARY